MRQDIHRPQQWAVARWGTQWLLALAVLIVTGLPGPAHAQDATFKNEELDQMLAPIALYPDSLLAQVLMASTYPADVQAAVAWSKAHPDTKGDAAISQVESQEWEASVKSLAAFPQVLAMMGAKPDDVQRLGDAFLADPARVMDRVQYLRKKAQEAGNLKSNEQQKISAATEENKQVIIIEPAKPNTVYVPVYQPTVVYGSWWYPSYPPYYWAPPPYYYPPGGAFVAGVFWGAAVVGISNGLWGGMNWGRGDVNINVNKYNNVNVNNKITNNNNNFNHNAARRGDVPYRDSKSREQYGKKQLDGAKDREAYRGKDGRDADRAKANDALKSRGADPAAGREKLQGTDRDKAANAVRDTDRAKPAVAQGGHAARDTDRAKPAVAQGGADRSQAGNTARNSDRSAGGASSLGSKNAGSHAPDRSAMSGVHNSSASRASADRGRASTQSMNQRASPSPTRAARPQPSAPAARAGGGGRHR